MDRHERKTQFTFDAEQFAISPELEEIQDIMRIDARDFDRLRDDIIKTRIIRDPIKVYRKGEKLLILGGYNRWMVAREITAWGEEIQIPFDDYSDIKPKDRRAFCFRDNLNRRHLSTHQKTAIAAELLRANPGKSSRVIAGEVGADHKTVEGVRRGLVATGEIPQSDKRTGKDGRTIKPGKAPARIPAAVPHPLDETTFILTPDGYRRDEPAQEKINKIAYYSGTLKSKADFAARDAEKEKGAYQKTVLTTRSETLAEVVRDLEKLLK